MKKYLYIASTISLVFCSTTSVKAADLANRLAGSILLQIESHGEAWYVDPENFNRYYLGRPNDAFELMRSRGVGITNFDLEKIPIDIRFLSGLDTDGDGLPDSSEVSIGTDINNQDTDNDGFSDKEEIKKDYNPRGEGVLPISLGFSEKQKGKIFLQVESHGEAWYVNPTDGKRYFLGRPDDAFGIMRSLGVGITDDNLEKIKAATPAFTASQIEKDIFAAINEERIKYGLDNLVWNDELAAVAREHSKNLAKENEVFTSQTAWSCDLPMIHHEGLDFGLYNSDRLNEWGVYYYSRAGENIALLSRIGYMVSYRPNDSLKKETDECQSLKESWDALFKSELEDVKGEAQKVKLVEDEIEKRAEQFESGHALTIVEDEWFSSERLTEEMAEGWMNSPGHRANILEEKYNESGIGVAYVNSYVIATQVFIERAECGFKNGSCCEKEGYYPYCFEPYSCEDNICN